MSGPVIEVKQGILRGAIRDNIIGGKYYSFRGIPYAEPPVGELRFKDPQALKPWNGVLDASQESKKSSQYDIITYLSAEGSDDCLYLNIATNSLREKRPVIVWIHGGAFMAGSNSFDEFGPDYLLKKDVVIVSLNYRLGILGFLNMDHEECAGNQGLKDQVEGLKWVKENIEVFGGDVDNITIVGESAGGACVHALCLLPLAKGLFHKAIMQSGTFYNPWVYLPTNKEVGYSVAKGLGNDSSNPQEVISFLRNTPVRELLECYHTIYEKEIGNLELNLVPTLDTKSTNPIMPCSSKELVKNSNNIPMIIGYNSHEGMIRLFHYTETFFFEQLQNDFENLIASILKVKKMKVMGHARSIRQFYFGSDEINESKVNEAVQFIGDAIFSAHVHAMADIQMQKTAPTYLYKFSYCSDYPGTKDSLSIKIEGTGHADELGCLFSSKKREKFLEGTRDYKTMDRMVTMWTNFAKTGDPTPTINELIPTKWKPLGKNKKNCLVINDDLTCIDNVDEKMWNVWKPLLTSL